ncbi:MAG: sodium:proton antiporter [Oscillospiraceae bacterium]|nr:sodium:proton antiporter [Oscillospiraceae bacterium]
MDMILYLLVFFPMAAAILSYLLGRKTKSGRDLFVWAVVAAEFCLSVLLFVSGAKAEDVLVTLPGVCGFGLNFTVDGFRSIYAMIAALMWLVTGLFSPEYFAHYRNRNRYYLFLLITLGATEAIFLSADLYTTFVFFEIMSLCSYVWVAQDEKPGSLRAGGTYLAVAVMGGLVMLMGIFLTYHQTGTLMIAELPEASEGKHLWAAALCMFVGFAGKAGAYPIHIWLPKAHPVAPAPASALLSGILTKTGIFGILVISCKMLVHDGLWGIFVLLIGVVTMFLGALLALFSVNFKRTLACSSVSQIGFILVGVGMLVLLGEENTLAVRGTFLHMVNHSLFKLILFLVAAVVYQNTHKLDLNDIRGFGRKKPLLMVCYLMGALGIGGIPGWSGYISKTLLHEGIVEYIHALEGGHLHTTFLTVGSMKIIEWIFLVSGGLTVAYMCKLFVAVFVEENRDSAVQARYNAKKPYWKTVSAVSLTLIAALIPILGALPSVTMDKLADLAQGFLGVHHAGHAVHYFAWVNLKGSVISIAIGAVLYLTVVRRWMMANGNYVNRWPEWLDLEEKIYRPLLLKILPGLFGGICRLLDGFMDLAIRVLTRTGLILAGVLDILTDGTVVLLRKTLYRDSIQWGELEEGNALTHFVGVSLNVLEELLNKTIWKNHEHKRDLEHWFVLKYTSFKENASLIERSLSYGLVLFCLGLCATLIYLLVSAFL